MGGKMVPDFKLVDELHRPRLLPLIRRKVRDQVEAEDVWQDVLAELLETYDVGQAIESLSAWLVRVAQNKIVDRYRRQKSRDDYRDLVMNEALPNGPPEAPSPEDERTRHLLGKAILLALEELPSDQRDVFVRHEIEGQSFEEIAAETGVNMNTLLSRKRYAVLFLREYLKEVYDELE